MWCGKLPIEQVQSCEGTDNDDVGEDAATRTIAISSNEVQQARADIRCKLAESLAQPDTALVRIELLVQRDSLSQEHLPTQYHPLHQLRPVGVVVSVFI